MLKLKFRYFGHLWQRADSLQKTLMLGKIECKRRRGQQRLKWLDGFPDSMEMNLSKLQETVVDGEVRFLQSMGLQRVRHNLATEQESPHTPHTVSLITYYIRLVDTFVTINEPILKHSYYIKFTLFIFLYFHPMSFFCSRISSRTHYF